MAGLAFNTDGKLVVQDSVLDTKVNAGRVAINAAENHVQIERATIFGTVSTHVLDASECIFMDTVTVQNRFEGCVRYSRVTSDAVLPRHHRLAVDTRVDFVSVDRHDPAHARLAERCNPAVLKGAEDGGEMGAFHKLRLAQRYAAYAQRLVEFTPAGLISGIIRLD
jgi:hypothetical protein